MSEKGKGVEGRVGVRQREERDAQTPRGEVQTGMDGVRDDPD